MNKKFTIAISLLAMLAGCAVGDDYEKPEVKTLQGWKKLDEKIEEKPELKISTKKNSVKANWWRNFSDPVLNELIATAEKNNFDLKIAVARLKAARANRLGELSPLFPEISGNVEATRGNRPFGSLEIINDSFQAGFDASWELDIFGGQRRRYEAAGAEAQAAAADLENVLISMRAEVMLDYSEYRSLQNQINLLRENVKSLSDTAELNRQQFDYGVIDAVDLAKVNSTLSNKKAALFEYETALEKTENNLTTLIGVLPGELDKKLEAKADVPVANRDFLISTPAEAIAQRPDVRAAERNLAAATALQGAAFANMFPNISLSAFFGLQDTTLSDRSKLWSLGSSLIVPIFSVGKVRAQIKEADANQEAAMAAYEKSVIAALAEIQTNLVAYINNEAKRESLLDTNQNDKKTLALTFKRYEQGEASLIDVFATEQNYYDSKNQLTMAEADVAESLIAFNKSLGR